MGKYIVLATLALGLSITLLANQGMQMDLDTSESQAERQEIVLARQIARSAFNNAVSKLKKNGLVGCCTGKSGEYEGGTYEVTYPDQGEKIIGDRNWRYVKLRVTGTHGENKYEITATVGRYIRETLDAVTAKSVDNFDVNGCQNPACISGVDEADGGGKSSHGLSLSPQKSLQGGDQANDPEDVCSEFQNGNGKNSKGGIEGKGGDGCDVVTRTGDQEQKTLEMMGEIENAILDNSDSDRVQVCDGNIECSISGSMSDEGILYVQSGEVTLNGNPQWDGLVYLSDSASVTLNGGGNSKNINGGLIMEEVNEFNLNGGGGEHNITYNTSTLLDLVDVIPELGEPVQVVNRSGRVVQ